MVWGGGEARSFILEKKKKPKSWEISDKSWVSYANHYTQLLFGHNNKRSQSQGLATLDCSPSSFLI